MKCRCNLSVHQLGTIKDWSTPKSSFRERTLNNVKTVLDITLMKKAENKIDYRMITILTKNR